MYDNGKTITGIAKYLQEQKIYCPDYYDFGGAKNGDYNWRNEAISRILKNKVYIGHTEYGKKINLSYKSKKVKIMPREEWQIVENTHEPIISKEQFERIQTRLNIHKKTRHRKYEWKLNGIVFCKECGTKMAIKVIRDKEGNIKSKKAYCGTAVRKNNNTICKRKYKAIDEDVVEKVVMTNVKEKIIKISKGDKLQNLILNQYNQNGTKVYDENIKILEKQLEKVDKTITSLYEDYKNNIIEIEDYKRFYKTEIERRTNIKNNINSILKEKEKRPTITKERLITIINDLSNTDNWNRDKLSEIIYNIEIDEDNHIYINYKYDILSKV